MHKNFLHSGQILSIFIVFFSMCSSYAYAQDENSQQTPSSGRQVVSVTPPLFQLSVSKNDIWQSSIKVVNGNPYPLTVYAEVLNFKAVGETGQGRFIPLSEAGGSNSTLGEWVTLSGGPYTIPPEQTEDISFFIEIPENASPGGHYAAIQISTEPPKESGEIAVLTSQVVTSLIFMRVEGDMREEGVIREFRATDSFIDVPDATFSLRFENKGNVHLQPKGDIVITNMWGTERGTIPVNYQTHFGNVLPGTIRDFTFSWKSDFKLSDIGRYKAEATLGYGEDGIKNVSAIAYFWIVPVKWTLIVLAVLALFISFVVFMVRAYVRRMLTLAGVDVEKNHETEIEAVEKNVRSTYRTVSAPIRHGVLDLRSQLTTVNETRELITTVVRFIVLYKYFFISVCALIAIFITITLYISHATQVNQDYEITIDGENASVQTK